MAVNEVVIGDLGLDSRDDCLDVVGGEITIPQNGFTSGRLSITFTYKKDSEEQVFFKTSSGHAITITPSSTSLKCLMVNTSDVITQRSAGALADGLHTIEFVRSGSGYVSCLLDGIGKWGLSNLKDFEDITISSTVNPLKSYVCGVDYYGYSYINSGDFGESFLPSVPSGYDGIINGATWWKKDVDENFLSPTAYRSTLLLPVENNADQFVTDYTQTAPVVTDSFWEPWNDGTIGFIVRSGFTSEVVIGDLSLDSRDDCRKYNSDGYDIVPKSLYGEMVSFDISMEKHFSAILGEWETATVSGIYVNIEVGGLIRVVGYNNGVEKFRALSTIPKLDMWVNVKIDINSTTATLDVGGEVVVVDSSNYTDIAIASTTIGSRDGALLLRAELKNVTFGNTSYINNGDYGSTILKSTPSGSDGTINGATWWKKDVDENFLTPTAYKSTLVLPVENNADQFVTDYTQTAPVITDSFWEPWNDGTIGFIVRSGFASEVVIGDLGLDSRDDCLKFEGVEYSVFSSSIGLGGDFNANFKMEYDGIAGDYQAVIGQRITSGEHSGVGGWVIYITPSRELWFRTGDGSSWGDVKAPPLTKGIYEVNVSLTGTSKSLTVNGVDYTGSDTVVWGTTETLAVGALRNGQLQLDHVCLSNINMTGYYNTSVIQNGDFGSTTLTDHSGNGNDGTINGATWWKKDVDENFLTPTAYKSNLLLPAENNADQFVTDYTKTAPVITDSFWEPWNDGTIGFIVRSGFTNEVVIGDLGLDSRDDCLLFDGVNDYVSFPKQSTMFNIPVIFIIGQSNADGRGLDTEAPSDVVNYTTTQTTTTILYKPMVKQSGTGGVTVGSYVDNAVEYTLSIGHSDPSKKTCQTLGDTSVYDASPLRHGCEQYVAKRLYDHFGDKSFMIIKIAVGGSSIEDDWGIENATTGKLWDLFYNYGWLKAKELLEAKNYNPVPIGAFWMQGEADTTASRAPLYEDRLQILVNRVRAIDPDMPIVIGGLSDHYDDANGTIVKNAQKNVVLSNDNVHLLPTDGTDGFAEAEKYGDDIHYNTTGLRTIGEYFVDLWLKSEVEKRISDLWFNISADINFSTADWIIPIGERSSIVNFIAYARAGGHLRARFSSGFDADLPVTLIEEGVYNLSVTYDGNETSFSLDGNPVGSVSTPTGLTLAPTEIGACYNNGQLNYVGSISSFVTPNGSYINNGDFGSTILTDHSGNGNDGTINGAAWWKQGVDENFLTPNAYRSTLLLPVENNADQNVVYTDGEPYWETESVEWEPWNDGTIGFTVSGQSILHSLINLLTLYEESDMKFSRTVKGVDLPDSGKHVFKKLPIAVKSTVSGDLVVRYSDDEEGDFTTITVGSDGIFFPVGTIGEIDIDASTNALVDAVVFGVL